MEKELLAVKGLSVSVEDKPILDHVNLEIGTGETHVLMGPNGTGKSTLGYTLMGSPRYHVTTSAPSWACFCPFRRRSKCRA